MEIPLEMKTNNILAKGKEYGSLTLLDHTQFVVQAIEYFLQHLNINLDIDAARYGAILHDLGKTHPYFQKMIQADGNDDFDFGKYKHRHEISSLAFLPAIHRVYWDVVIDMVVAHHKSIERDFNNRGILDISTNDRIL